MTVSWVIGFTGGFSMGYVNLCKKHGQYKSDYCGECIEDLYTENKRLKEALEQIAKGDVAPSSIKGYIDEAYQDIARAALKDN